MGTRSDSRVESLVLGFILILLGSLFLLHNFAGINIFPHIWKLWPLVLVVLGGSHLLRWLSRTGRINVGQRQAAGFAAERPPRRRGKEIVLVVVIILVGLLISRVGDRDGSTFPSFSITIGGHSVEKSHEQSLDLTRGDLLRLTNEFGPVTIRASEEGEAQLNCRMTVTADSEEQAETELARTAVTVTSEEGALEVSCRLPGPEGSVHLEAEMELLVPIETALQLESRNGEVLVRGLRGDIRVLAANEEVTIREIDGLVSVTSGRGDITLQEINGPVTASSRGGDIEASECSDDLTVIACGGTIECGTIRGRTVIELQDGKLVLSGTRGPVELDLAESKAKFEEISGPLSLEGDNCGLSLTNCYGTVSLNGDALNVETANTWGDLIIDCTDSTINLDNTLGGLDARLEHGSFTSIGKLDQGRISGNYTPITVGSCEGLLEITSRQGDVTLRHPEPQNGSQVSVTTSGGNILLELNPDQCDYNLNMTAVSGMITSFVTGLEITTLDAPKGDEEETLIGVARCGSGEQRIELRTEYADIQLKSID